MDAAKVVVVGGGIAGLAAAAFAARAGAQVTLFERQSEPGGRGRSREERGFVFNMGPHALYLKGEAMAALQALGIDPPGRSPATSGGLVFSDGRLRQLPGGASSLLTTRLLSLAEKVELAALMRRLPELARRAETAIPIGAFVGREIRSPRLRALLLSLVRLTSYANLPEVMSSDAAMAQLVLGLGSGVRYLDGGWSTLVDALDARGREAGVARRFGVKVERVLHDGERIEGVELAGGERVRAEAVILALGPHEASALVDRGRHTPLEKAAAACVPVRAACLDVALARLPKPRRTFALGLERPLYFSVHSAAAKLAPSGGATIALARYLGRDDRPERAELDAELDALLDALQPGWRDHLIHRKLMRDLVVTHDLPAVDRGGLAGRTPGRVPGIDGLWLAGDWVGPRGQLVDASFASGRAAALEAAGRAGPQDEKATG